MSTIAVTGANGFVGRQVVRLAGSEGWDVVGVARSERGARLVADAGGRPVVLEGLETGAATRALEGALAVVHLIGIGAERGDATYEAVNVGCARTVAEAARRAGVPRIVFFSGLGVARYGQSARCTNPYFLSKLAAEVELFRSGLEVVVFRPSYIVGPGDGLVPRLLGDMAAGVVELPGDGRYRLQPVWVGDAAAAILAAVTVPARVRAVDLVGPEPIAYRDFIQRLGRAARGQSSAREFRVQEIPVDEAYRQALSGGYKGWLPDEVDCLLCDQVAETGPLEALIGRSLTALDIALSAAVRSAQPRLYPRSFPQ